MAANRLDPQLRFLLMKEFHNYANSPRKLQMTSEEFRVEASREIGHEVTLRHVEGCAESFGFRMVDVFKSRATNGGRSIYSEFYLLQQRVAVLEEKLKDL